ncbi:MAG TPA: sigma-70 family RNA polymerase sigma factor [Gemmatimonadaceae bacterium]|nr:sigma-70 family RNA polymerase sigma factor [Gemmatimonadaceae bacterium]
MNDVERLFREYHAPLVRYLTRRLGDRDWAEEVAQETFVRALRQTELTNERAWLFAVATNLIRDEARKDARRRRHLELLREEAKADSIVEPPETDAERAEERAIARKAIEALTERDREALLMKEEGLDYHEIAEALELSVASVGTTLSRARRRLVEAYEELRKNQDRRAV